MSQVLRTLKQVDDTASECGINLNDRVDRCDDFHPYHGGYTIVYNGTLRPHGEIVAIKSLRLSPLPEKVAVDVRAPLSHYFLMLQDNHQLAYHNKRIPLVPTRPSEYCQNIWRSYEV